MSRAPAGDSFADAVRGALGGFDRCYGDDPTLVRVLLGNGEEFLFEGLAVDHPEADLGAVIFSSGGWLRPAALVVREKHVHRVEFVKTPPLPATPGRPLGFPSDL